MSSEVTLTARRRSETGKGAARKLRAAGDVPAVVYGGEDEAVSLILDRNEATHLFQNISVENTIVGLKVDGEKTPIQTLIREIQAHPFRPEILHVDFLRIQKGVAIEVEIPIHLEGSPVGVKQGEGILDQVIHTVTVRCIPSAIPDSITVDIEHLDVGDSLHVSELEVPEDLEVVTDGTRIVAQVALLKGPKPGEEEEEDLEAGLTEEAPEPELIGGEPSSDEEE
jgi:large subunit ribosomal protein L25